MARPPDPARQADILQAARSIFAERGFRASRMAEIAERAGTAVGTLYLYYQSKEALALGLSNEYYRLLGVAVSPAFEALDLSDGINRMVQNAVEFSAQEVDLLRMACLRIDLAELAPVSLPPARFYLQVQTAEWLERFPLPRRSHDEVTALAQMIPGWIIQAAEACILNGEGQRESVERLLIQSLNHILLG